MKPICVKCGVPFVPVRLGVKYIEQRLLAPDNTLDPYKIWSADLYQCPVCYVKILHGFGDAPVAFSWDRNFKELLKRALEEKDTVLDSAGRPRQILS